MLGGRREQVAAEAHMEEEQHQAESVRHKRLSICLCRTLPFSGIYKVHPKMNSTRNSTPKNENLLTLLRFTVDECHFIKTDLEKCITCLPMDPLQ